MNNQGAGDDEYPPIRREALAKLAALAESIEAGGVAVLSKEDAAVLRDVARLMRLPGVMEFLEGCHDRHMAGIYWQKVRRTLWKIVMVTAGVAASVAVFISQIDGAIKAVRGWLKSLTG